MREDVYSLDSVLVHTVPFLRTRQTLHSFAGVSYKKETPLGRNCSRAAHTPPRQESASSQRRSCPYPHPISSKITLFQCSSRVRQHEHTPLPAGRKTFGSVPRRAGMSGPWMAARMSHASAEVGASGQRHAPPLPCLLTSIQEPSQTAGSQMHGSPAALV